jgi:acyl-CoA reductase-like NAD-dependent aldehyde dehydrogenase/nicotinamidase-related amidase
MKPVLLLVDLQNDFLDAPGLEPPRSEVVRRAAALLRAARDRGVPVVHCVTTVDRERDGRMPHWKAADRWSCVRGSRGHAPPAELEPGPGESVVDKAFFSAFASTAPGALDETLARWRADAVVLAGVHLHGCVRATALDAYQRGLEVWIAEDAVASDDPLHAAVTRRYLEGRAARFAAVAELAEMFAAGHRDAPATGRREIPHRSPRETSRVLFSVPVGGAREAARASAAAREALAAWRATPHEMRSGALLALADRLGAEADSLARDMAVEVGKPVKQGAAEARRAAELVRRAASLRNGETLPSGEGSASRRVPLGVIAAITPWNNPVAIAWGKLAPALALGNAAVWKPAPAGTRIALRTLELARGSGLPEGLVSAVTGDHGTAAAVMADPGVDAVTLSGSSFAGWAAQEACARRRIPIQAELGGNNCAIVWSGADVAHAARELARGAFSFAGQRCTANRRVVVEARLRDALLERLTAATAELAWGDPLDPATDVGPLVSLDARDRVEAALERAASSGARVLRPHATRPEAAALRAAGAYCAAALVWGAAHDSEIVQEETFGPVLVLEPAGDFDEALALADGVRQGLVAALFAGREDRARRERFLAAARAGILKWNASTSDADAAAPFGGWKASGVGPPEHGVGDVEFYGRLQALYGVTSSGGAS